MGKTTYTDDDFVLKKSNALLNAKFKASDIENDIMNIAMTRVEAATINDKDVLVARLYPSDINRFVHKGKNIYRELKTAAKLLTGHSMLIDTPNGFHAFAMITDVIYENNILEVRFSEHLRPHLIGLTSHYATENIALITMLKGYAKRIYEILNEHKYKLKTAPNGVYSVTYRLNEFRFMIGLANIDEAGVQKYIAKSDNDINWDELYESVAKEKMYPVWQRLKENIIIPAQKELKEKADICFEFEGLREGRAIKSIRFDIMRNTPSREWVAQFRRLREDLESTSSDEYKQAVYPQFAYNSLYQEYVGHNKLTVSDLDTLMQKADFDEECVRTAIKMADAQENVSNYMGWIIACIERGYAAPIEVVEGSSQKADKANEAISECRDDKQSVAERAWNKIKDKDDYPKFVVYMEKSGGLNEESFEVVFTAEEMVGFYTDWKIKEGKKRI